MSRNTNTTLIIHGPITPYTIFSLYKYKDVYDIVVTCPTPKPSQKAMVMEISSLVAESGSNISLLTYGDVLKEGFNNNQNKYLHFFSVSLALQACITPCAIKIRSDEFYSNLQYFEEEMLSSKNKITTNDVFFRNFNAYPLHPSDHLVGGSVEDLSLMFNTAKKYCMVKEETIKTPIVSYVRGPKNVNMTAEQYLGISLFENKVVDQKEITDELVIKFMKENFHIVKNEQLGFYRVVFNSHKEGRLEYFGKDYFNTETDINNIEHYGK